MVSVLSGIVLGFAGGFALQRGGFCMHSAFRSIIFEKDHSILRAWILILVINIPALLLLEQLGVIFPARAPLSLPAGAIGGTIFGVGMVLAGGCVSGTWYRAAKGMTGSVVALLGFAAGGLIATRGIIAPLRSWLFSFETTIAGEEASLFNVPALFSSSYFPTYTVRWVIAVALLVPLVYYLLRAPKSQFIIGWKWPLTGLVLGVIAVGAWVFSSLEYRDYGLSIVQPTNALSTYLLFGEPDGINWASWFLIGLVPGALVAAAVGGDLKLRVPSAARLMQNLGGGILMGLGANIAGGCNIGHGITGVSVLSLGSVWATVTTIGGVWLATWIVFKRARATSPATPA